MMKQAASREGVPRAVPQTGGDFGGGNRRGGGIARLDSQRCDGLNRRDQSGDAQGDLLGEVRTSPRLHVESIQEGTQTRGQQHITPGREVGTSQSAQAFFAQTRIVGPREVQERGPNVSGMGDGDSSNERPTKRARPAAGLGTGLDGIARVRKPFVAAVPPPMRSPTAATVARFRPAARGCSPTTNPVRRRR